MPRRPFRFFLQTSFCFKAGIFLNGQRVLLWFKMLGRLSGLFTDQGLALWGFRVEGFGDWLVGFLRVVRL